MDGSTTGIRKGMQRHLTAAMIFVDDFTGRPIPAGKLQISVSEEVETVFKPDGCLMFLNYGGAALTVTAGGLFYREQTVKIVCAELDPLCPAVRVRLSPSRRYPVPPRAICLEGMASPDREILLWCENDPLPLRLRCDYRPDGAREGRELRLYDPKGADPGGRSFVLLRSGVRKAEIFSVRQVFPEGDGACLLEAPLESACKMAGASILPVYITRTEADGRFFLLLPGMGVETVICRIRMTDPDGTVRERTASLQTGSFTRLDLDGQKA